MPTTFIEWLIVFLIILALGGKELAFAIAKKIGWINGTERQIKAIQENHMPHIEQKLDRLIEQNQEILIIVRDLKDKNG